MFIDGFGISAYRSFGDELQLIGPFNKINFFIGQNNSGKSNILRFLDEHLSNALLSARSPRNGFNLADLDQHLGRNSGQIKFALGLKRNGTLYQKIVENKKAKLDQQNPNDKNRAFQRMELLLQFPEITQDTALAWFVYEANLGQHLKFSEDIISQILASRVSERNSSQEGLSYQDWGFLLGAFTDRVARKYTIHMVKETIPYLLQAVSPIQLEMPDITVIQAIREIKADGSQENYNFNGVNIVRELKTLERPDVGKKYDESKARFETINQFVRDVVGKGDIRLEIPASERTIQVAMDGKTLPLENLGTGIHEVIILAIAATLLEEQIICIEEPEIHLHPLLQKKLVRYLDEHTTNQYFIATHSASMIDVPYAAVFHVKHNGEQSIVTPALTSSQRFEISTDLGYRASDILQANCIIWVEGPSDRIYLNHWLNAYDSELVESIHYSIMFYGGRLLSHLSADDKEIEEFISLRKINQNIAILIDSDRSKKGQAMNATKRRVRGEFDQGSGFAWITNGREVENYVPIDLIEKAVKATHKQAVRLNNTDQYAHCYHFVKNNGELQTNNIDKVKIARWVADADADLGVFDLQDRIRDTVNFIRRCNDLPN